MKPWALIVAGLLAASSAAAQVPPAPAPFPGVPVAPVVTPAEPPPTGIAWIVWGSLLTAAGAGNLAFAPACELVGNLRHPDVCVGTSLAFGAAFVAAGIPLIVVGARKWSAFQDWTKGVQVGPIQRGAAVSWGASW